MTFAPNLPNFFNGKLDEPPMREKNIIGITTAFSIETKIVPNGAIKPTTVSKISLFSAKETLIITPATAPRTHS